MSDNLNISSPVTASIWENRLIVRDSEDPERVEVYYREKQDNKGRVYKVKRDLPSFTYFLAHQPIPEQPEQGLGLSYAQTVGALYRIWRKGFIEADFKVEQDRILAEIRRAGMMDDYEIRPDFEPTDTFEEPPTDGVAPAGPIG